MGIDNTCEHCATVVLPSPTTVAINGVIPCVTAHMPPVSVVCPLQSGQMPAYGIKGRSRPASKPACNLGLKTASSARARDANVRVTSCDRFLLPTKALGLPHPSTSLALKPQRAVPAVVHP